MDGPTVYVILCATAAGFAVGVVRDVAGYAGLGVTVVSWAGLLVLRRRQNGAAALLDASLREALGADYRDRVVHPRAPEPGRPRARQPGVVRMMRMRHRYAHDRDIAYGPAGKQNLLDIWRRKDTTAGAPVLVQVPGGAWVMGNKQGQAYPLMTHLVERGWICVSISHRLAPKALWPAHVEDVKRAVAWVRDNIADYGGDPGFIAITGGSSGGHLASLTALTWDDPDFQPGFANADTRVQAAVPLYGVYDWSDEVDTGGKIFLPHLQRTVMRRKWSDDPAPFRKGSPLRRIRPDAPPFFVLVGVNDTMVSPRQPRAFVPRLRATSTSPVAYTELPDAQHNFDLFSSPRAAATAEAIGCFLGVVYGAHVAVLRRGTLSA
jgi:acetyl esterase/lipase